MPLTQAQTKLLVQRLQDADWKLNRKKDTIYAPNRQFWLSVECPWTNDIDDFYDRMMKRRQRVLDSIGLKESENNVDNLDILISALKFIRSKQKQLRNPD